MLSVVLLADAALTRLSVTERGRAIVKTLAALVPLVVSDLVADALIVSQPDVGLKGLEDRAGCKIFEGADLGLVLSQTIGSARREMLLVLRPGYAPDATFPGEIARLVEERATRPMALLATPETFVQRLFSSLAPPVGLIASRTALAAKARGADVKITSLRRDLTASPMRSRAVLL